ncbi:MAG: hypothetical protein KatS3mg033_0953 [Thermonema sp.]|jgi:hypothetical protein|uniref:DUF1573 domain-containing protein n=1 Tax=Thermonema TaxID=28194 RepID=UPI0008FFC845|nr:MULTISPECIES: DUF1573 domain-containing protein [Thermonema]GIV39153.1 MAG: hypothetical protein KatS3mg033_0953 [Thermonema sp.]
MKKRINVGIVLWLLLLCSSAAWAQGKFSFNKEIHDFGNIDEGTVATYEFVFTNVGDQPIVLQSVSASCGCTTPYYTREPVLPGKKGVIKVSYNSLGRPGAFTKSVTIRSNASEPIKTLLIKGYVHPKTEAKTNPDAPDLRFDKTVWQVGSLQQGQSAKGTFILRNNGKKTLEIYRVSTSCDCIEYTLGKKRIEPGETTAIEVLYTAKKAGKQVRDYIQLQTNDGKQTFHSLVIMADVIGSSPVKENNANPLGF